MNLGADRSNEKSDAAFHSAWKTVNVHPLLSIYVITAAVTFVLCTRAAGLESSLIALPLVAIPAGVLVRAIRRMGAVAFATPAGLPNVLVFLTTAMPALTILGWDRGSSISVWGLEAGTADTASVLVLASVAFSVGSVTDAGSQTRFGGSTNSVDPARLRAVTRAVLVMGGGFFAFRLATVSLETRGVNQIVRGLDDTIQVGVEIAAVVALVGLAVAAANDSRVLPARSDYLLGLAPGILASAYGERGPLLVSLVVLATFYLIRRGGSARVLIAWAAVAYLAAAGVWIVRSGRSIVSIVDPPAVFDATFGSIYKSFVLTWQSYSVSDSYTEGSTYLSALQFLLPGPIARWLFGEPQTATLVFRDSIGFANPDAGLGYSLVSEALMNFGAAGVVVISALLGLALSLVATRANTRRFDVSSTIYFVLFAFFVVYWRADSLSLLKILTYAAAMILLTRWATTSSFVRSPASGRSDDIRRPALRARI